MKNTKNKNQNGGTTISIKTGYRLNRKYDKFQD